MLSTHVLSLIDFNNNLNISIGNAIKNISCIEKTLDGLVECVLFDNLFYSDTSLFKMIDSINKSTKIVNHFNDFNFKGLQKSCK